MARTHRFSSSSASDNEELPRYFGKNGFPDQDPNKVKKNGAGRFNWGNPLDDVDEIDATDEFNFAHTRRRSNSSSLHAGVPRGFNVEDVIDEDEEMF